MMTPRSIVAVPLLALAGCVMPTKQPVASEVRPVPADRVLKIAEQSQPTGRVNVTRDVGMLGSGCYLGVMVDGELAVKIDTAERASFDLSAGRHVLTATWIEGRGLCGLFYSDKSARARRRSTELLVDAGQDRSYRVHTDTDGEITIEPAL